LTIDLVHDVVDFLAGAESALAVWQWIDAGQWPIDAGGSQFEGIREHLIVCSGDNVRVKEHRESL